MMNSSRIDDYDTKENISYVSNTIQALFSFHSRHHPDHRGTMLDTNLKEEENNILIDCRKARIPGKNAVLKYSLTGCWLCDTKYISSFATVILSVALIRPIKYLATSPDDVVAAFVSIKALIANGIWTVAIFFLL